MTSGEGTSETNRSRNHFKPYLERIDRIQEKYKGKNYVYGIIIDNPVKQERDDENGKTCLAATAINVMKAFSLDYPTEKDLVKELSLHGRGFDGKNQLVLGDTVDFLERNGLRTNNETIWGYPQKIVDGIRNGGVIIELIPSKSGNGGHHAKLLTGIEINEEGVMVREYDPDPIEPESRLVPIRRIIEETCNTDQHTSMTLILPPADS